MSADHRFIIYFDDGDSERVGVACLLSGSDRPCAVIICPVDHEDVTRECIDAHGAEARDECWVEEYLDASGREGLNTEALAPVSFPVTVYYDEGVAVQNV